MRLVADPRLRLASIFFLGSLGAVAGCGDNVPARDGGGGGGGTAGASDAGDAGGSGGTGGTGGRGGTGGNAGDGGPDTGDAGGGSDGRDAIPEAPTPCYTVAFLSPTDGTMLTAANDKSGDNCADGFQLDVQISTSAPDFTDVSLFAGNALLKSAQVSAGRATFTNVQIASTGNTLLSIQFPSTTTCTDPTTKATVSVDCHVPSCSVSKPVISGAHPVLNGVAAPAGDRVSSTGSPYQAAFEVTTDIEDGQSVALLIDNAASPSTVTTVTATATSGKATFAGVTLVPDGQYEIQATCTARNGVVGRSMRGTYPVDTTPPNLTVSRPGDGAFFGPTDLTNGKFQVCGKTDNRDNDAVSLPAALGAAANNFCVTVGGAKSCVPVTAANTDTCVDVTCSGGAPFDITVQLNDAGSNVTAATIRSVACASSLPSVQIIAPISDAPTFTDPSKHLLAAGASQAFRDQSASTAGAQTDVVACSNRAGSAALLVGHAGDPSPSQLGASVNTVAAVPADGCPVGLGFVARFPGVTLPESTENADGSLATGGATRLRVDVTDVSTATGSSPPIDIWVDSVPPVTMLQSPSNLCGSFHQAALTFVTAVSFTSDTADVTLTVTNGASTDTLNNPTFASGVATFSTVTFDQGLSSLAATAADKAGNTASGLPLTCTVTVGMAPVVTFTTPTAGKQLCSAAGVAANCIDDADAVTPGWQGTIAVHVTSGGAPITTGTVTFSVGATTLGTVNIDGNGDAQLTNVTFFDGSVTITATTSDIPNRGVGTGTVTVVVDLGPPDAPTNLTATVLSRRQTSFQLSWTAPGDNGQRVAGYDVRYAKVLITAANFDDAAVATAVTYGGSPALPGQPDGIAVQNLYIENGYFFAVRAFDAAGNKSAIAATAASVTANFNRTLFPSTSGTNEELGYSLSGGGDVNGDGLSDVLAGTFNGGKAYLFFGATNLATAAPSVVFSSAGTGFGNAVSQIGDVDNDGLPDIAISTITNPQRIFIYKGRLSWPLTLTDAQADYVVTGDATYNGSAWSSIARLGDFTGDGIDDFAIGARGFAVGGTAAVGRVVIIPGKSTGFASVTLPDTTNAITIDGDPALTRTFGFRVLGLGHFYSVSSGTTLVVSAPGLASQAATNMGRVFAFHGQTGTGGSITLATADNVTSGPASGTRIGVVLSNLGPILGALPAVGIGNPGDTVDFPGTIGAGYVQHGDTTAGPFGSRLIVSLAGGTGVGGLLLGGGLSGRDLSLSLIGDSGADVVVGAEVGPKLAILDGAKLASKTAPVEAGGAAEVQITLPAGWTTGDQSGSIIPDMNGDGFPDFCLGNAFGAVPGGVAVYW